MIKYAFNIHLYVYSNKIKNKKFQNFQNKLNKLKEFFFLRKWQANLARPVSLSCVGARYH